VDGNLSVKLKHGRGEAFVWKKKEIEVTRERLQELDQFRQELTGILDEPPAQ